MSVQDVVAILSDNGIKQLSCFLSKTNAENIVPISNFINKSDVCVCKEGGVFLRHYFADTTSDDFILFIDGLYALNQEDFYIVLRGEEDRQFGSFYNNPFGL